MGGSYGHLSHPYEQSTNLSFKEMRDMIDQSITGSVPRPTEKTDGQALAVSFKNGHLIAARNKGHLKNAGETALSAQGVCDKFAGRGSLTTAFASAVEDLEVAFGIVDEDRLQEIFDEGRNFMHIEIMHPDSANVIEYNHPYIVFHGTMSYDGDGNAIGEDVPVAFEFAQELSPFNDRSDRTFDIISPAVLDLPDLTETKPELRNTLISRLEDMMSEFDLSYDEHINDYHVSFWSEWLDENSPEPVTDTIREVLISRWAMNDKSRRLREIPELKSWAKDFEKNELKGVRKEINLKFENIFLTLGVNILSSIDSVLADSPAEARDSIKSDLTDAVNSIMDDPDVSRDSKEKLLFELKRLEAIGGFDSINSIEGFVFYHDGHAFKLTGSFAPANQILGISRYNR